MEKILLMFVSKLNESYVPKYVSRALPNPLTYVYNKFTRHSQTS